MKVTIKSFDVGMEVKNLGIEFDIYSPNGEHLGDVVLTKTGLTWCEGRTTRVKGKRVTWEEFIKWASEKGQ